MKIFPIVLTAMVALWGCKTRDDSVQAPTLAVASTDEAKSGATQVPAAGKDDIPAPPDVSAAPADAQKNESGLMSKVLSKGTGTVHPTINDKVKVHYTGWTTDGKMFDSSVKRGQPAQFPLRNVIPGWTKGLQLMVEGEKRRFWIPGKLAYGEKPAGNAANRPGPSKGMLVFDVELLSFETGPIPPTTPEDVGAIPANAKKTKSGLAYRILKKGKGKKKPKATDTVEVEFTGWSADGKIFGSSVLNGKPAVLPLQKAFTGWREGLELMVVGEKRRLWIPGKLAFGEALPKGHPQRGGPSRGHAGHGCRVVENNEVISSVCQQFNSPGDL